MIQRVQSLYLLLAAVAAVLSLFCPLVSGGEGDAVVTLSGIVLQAGAAQRAAVPWGIAVLGVVVAVVSVVALMGWRNRPRQMRQCTLLMLLVLGQYLAVAGYAYSAFGGFSPFPALHIGLSFPALSLVGAYLARRAIAADEALVRAADRIR